MPLLIIQNHGTWQSGPLSGRVLIGRWPGNTIIIDDPWVSRIHAWIVFSIFIKKKNTKQNAACSSAIS